MKSQCPTNKIIKIIKKNKTKINNNQKEKMKSKKAFIASTLIDFYAFVVFILVVLIFFVIFLLMKGCDGSPSLDDVPHQKLNVDSNYVLLTWLKNPLDSQTRSAISKIYKINQINSFSNGHTTKVLNFSKQQNYTFFLNASPRIIYSNATIDLGELFSFTNNHIAFVLANSDPKIKEWENLCKILSTTILPYRILKKYTSSFTYGLRDNEGTSCLDKTVPLIEEQWKNATLFTMKNHNWDNNTPPKNMLVLVSDKCINYSPQDSISEEIQETAIAKNISIWQMYRSNDPQEIKDCKDKHNQLSQMGGEFFTYNNTINFTDHIQNKILEISNDRSEISISVDFGTDAKIDFKSNNTFNHTTLEFKKALNTYTTKKCTPNTKCLFPIKISGKKGSFSLGNIQVQKTLGDAKKRIRSNLKKANIADLIAFSQTDEDLEELRGENINSFFNNAYHDWWHLIINYPDGTKEEYGHSYTADTIPSIILAATMRVGLFPILPAGLSYVYDYSILPESEKININQSIPSLNKDPINIEFSNWVITYASLIPFT